MSYKHLSITERELTAIYRAAGKSICQIAKLLGRNKSTISRELARNPGDYLPSKAQARYRCRRKKCRPHKLLEKPELFALVKRLFFGCQWSPEQRRSEGNRGKIPISHELSERPVEANERIRRGDWEADTIVGYNHKSGLLTLVDRKSRYLLCEKLTRLGSKEVKTAMIEALRGEQVHTLTPDRGREFQLHGDVAKELGAEFYFPPPHQPW